MRTGGQLGRGDRGYGHLVRECPDHRGVVPVDDDGRVEQPRAHVKVLGRSRHRDRRESGCGRCGRSPSAKASTSARVMKLRRPARNGRSSAIGSPLRVTTKVSPPATASITFALSLRSSRCAIVRLIRHSVARSATASYADTVALSAKARRMHIFGQGWFTCSKPTRRNREPAALPARPARSARPAGWLPAGRSARVTRRVATSSRGSTAATRAAPPRDPAAATRSAPRRDLHRSFRSSATSSPAWVWSVSSSRFAIDGYPGAAQVRDVRGLASLVSGLGFGGVMLALSALLKKP